MILELIKDALLASVAAMGFAAVSNPPKRAYVYCAVIAALGHSFRSFLMGYAGCHIVLASFFASLLIGVLSVSIGPKTKIPPETYLYPALLPMIPGVYAYKTFGAMLMCVSHSGEEAFDHYFYLFGSNGLTCLFILTAMVVGATVPMFLLPRISFQSTRPDEDTKEENQR